MKIVLPFFGALGELWLGHESWRTLIAPDGKFVVENINDWQHSTMYLAFIISGVIDLIGFYSQLPHGTEHSFLALSFLAQGLLLVFHLKGPAIEVTVHLILVIQIFSTFLAILAEAANRGNIILATMRPMLTLLQGIWWIQTAFIMFTSDPAYDPDYMGGTMMAPAVFVFHLLWLSAASIICTSYIIRHAPHHVDTHLYPLYIHRVSRVLYSYVLLTHVSLSIHTSHSDVFCAVLLVMRSRYSKVHNRDIQFSKQKHKDSAEYRYVLDSIGDGDIELAGTSK